MTSDDRHGSYRASSAWTSDAARLISMVRAKPEALLLIGAGLALIMRGERGWPGLGAGVASSRSGYQPTGDDGSAWSEGPRGQRMGAPAGVQPAREAMRSASESLSEASESMTGYASDMMRQASETASQYASTASRWADDAREGLMDRSSRLALRARTLPEELDEAVQDHPLVLAALGVAVGAALGASLPATSIENRALGVTRDQLAGAAQQATRRLGAAAEEVYDEARRSAQSHGLTPDKLREAAKDVAMAAGSAFVSTAAGSPPQGAPGQTGGVAKGDPGVGGRSPGASPGARSQTHES